MDALGVVRLGQFATDQLMAVRRFGGSGDRTSIASEQTPLHPSGLPGIDHFGANAAAAAHLSDQPCGGSLANRTIHAEDRDNRRLDL